jgi:hypothetical protein
VALVALAACGAHSGAPQDNSASVAAFMTQVERTITAEGPAGWRAEFSDAPSFYMAAQGRLVFSSGAAARTGIDELARQITRIELRFGHDLRLDELGGGRVGIGCSYSEQLTDRAGQTHPSVGYLTAILERSGDSWRFRSAHWSEGVAVTAVGP